MRRLARRLPLRTTGFALQGLALPVLLASTTVGVSLVATGLAAQLADRWAWRHTRTADLRSRYRKLGARMEVLDAHVASIRQSEELHRTLTEAFGDVVVQVTEDIDGRIAFANPTARRLLDLADGRLPGDLRRRIAEHDGDLREDVWATREGPRRFRWHIVAVVARDGTDAVRLLARDVTAEAEARAALERARDEAREAVAARGRAIATVSHEIRNPLNGLSGMAELLAAAKLAPRQKAQAEGLRRAAGALSRIIADLLDEARLETGKLELAHEPFDPCAMSEQACELMAAEAHAKGIDIAVRVGAVPALVEGDEGRVRQIVMNLLGNAIKFTQEGQVTLRLDMQDNGLVWSVEDTGPGLAAHDRERIFDVFAHADDGLARRLGGIGLGLAVSKQLAERMGGRLSLVSAPGEGSTFSFHLPVEAEAEETTRSLDGLRALLVTPRPRLAGPLREALAHLGATLVVADTRRSDWRTDAAWFDGPVLVDETVGETLPNAIVLRRGADEAAEVVEERFLRLPWRRASLARVLGGGAEVTRPDPREGVRTVRGGLEVLVAEDDPVTQLLTTACLERAGHRVRLAGDGAAAARLFREAADDATEETPFDAVVMDLNMGAGDAETVGDGLSAVGALRRIEGARERTPVPIVVATGDARSETREAALAAGADEVMVKPMDMDALVAWLDERCGINELQEAV